MIPEIVARLQQKHRTMRYPKAAPPPMPDRFRGRPVVHKTRCVAGCNNACEAACPTGALSASTPKTIDLGKCLFCPECAAACPHQAISYSDNYQLAARERTDLVVPRERDEIEAKGVALDEALRKLLGRSLKLRQVSAGGCNACEADSNVLTTVGWDLSRFGIKFVASPRHADGLLVTGPVSQNMALALKKTYDAVSDPRIVIAVGTCAISGGVFADRPEVCNGASSVVPVDLYIPGCPPHPLTILDGLLRLIGRIGEGKK
jgi:Ni,Fe-hydrogenase III small subunit/Pyruvate/2-oxoacid:ferredoxin oxidoreductase delta subunit